ncbi:MAG: serine/threonine protein kinase [Myxococcales bacterium]|nr:serine/threonine protein kinase [Myxococcales bacterium]
MTSGADQLDETRVNAPPGARLGVDTRISAAPAFHEDAPAPAVIGRYIVLEKLGHGGMGVVHAAYDPRLERKVALKVVHAAHAGAAEHRLRMVREAQVLARLSHPNVVAVFDVGEADDQVYLAMDLIRGVDLRVWLDEPRSREAILEVFLQAGQGLAAAHAVGLVHRDFKPANVLVGDDGRARVVDFGLAAVDADERAATSGADASSGLQRLGALTLAGSIVGTPAFMAPEQIAGETATSASDQFSFCVALWTALTGIDPFGGETLEQRRAEILVRRPRELHGGARLSRALRAALVRGLAADPSRRFPQIDELLAALGRARAAPRRRLVGLAAAVAAAAAAAWAASERDDPGARCSSAAEAAAQLWSPAQAGRVGAALRAVDRPYAGAMAEAVGAELGRYAAAWGALQQRACEGHARMELSDGLHDRQVACLHERRAAFAAVTTRFATAAEASLADALDRVDRLRPVDECEDLVRLSGETGRAPALQAARDALNLRLAALEVAHQEDAEAAATARGIAEEARALAAHDLVARSLALSAVIVAELGEAAAAEAQLEEAWLASLTWGDDEAMADVASRYAGHLSSMRHRPIEAERWLRAVQAIDARPGEVSAVTRRYLVRMEGAIASQLGRHEQALAAMDRAVAEALADRGEGSYAASLALQNRSYVLREMGRYAESRADAAAALRGLEATVGPDHPKLFYALEVLATTHDDLGEPAAAQAHYTRGIELMTRLYSPEDPRVGQLRNNLGESLYREGRHAGALAQFSRAAEILARTRGDEHVSTVLARVGVANALVALARTGEARGIYEAANASLAASLPEGHPIFAYAHVGLGRVALAEGDPAAAIAALEEGLRLRGTGAPPGERAEAELLLARALRAHGEAGERTRTLAAAAVADYRAAGPAHAAALAEAERLQGALTDDR